MRACVDRDAQILLPADTSARGAAGAVLALSAMWGVLQLLRDVRAFQAAILREEGRPDTVVLACKLAAVGWSVTMRTALGGGAGQACFHNLRYAPPCLAQAPQRVLCANRFLQPFTAPVFNWLRLTSDPACSHEFLLVGGSGDFGELIIDNTFRWLPRSVACWRAVCSRHGAGLRQRPTCALQGAVHHPAGHRAVPGADQAASDRVCGQPRAAGAARPAAVLGDGGLVRSAGPGLPAVAPGKEPAVKVAASQGAPLAARRRPTHAALCSLCCHSVATAQTPAFFQQSCSALRCFRAPRAQSRQAWLQVRDVGVGGGSAKHASASAGCGDSPASPVSALSSAGSPCERSTSPCAATRSPPAAPGQGGPGSPFALADVADGCVGAGLQPRARSRSLLSDCMAEHDVRPRSLAGRGVAGPLTSGCPVLCVRKWLELVSMQAHVTVPGALSWEASVQAAAGARRLTCQARPRRSTARPASWSGWWQCPQSSRPSAA